MLTTYETKTGGTLTVKTEASGAFTLALLDNDGKRREFQNVEADWLKPMLARLTGNRDLRN